MGCTMEIVALLDDRGRLVLPRDWRERYARSGTVVLRVEGDRIVVEPLRLPDLTEFFDSVEVDLKSDLGDWESVRGEFLGACRR